jgi:circadian clock protein KaiC
MNHAARDAGACVPTGIPGFDEICGGGLPRGRITVVFGGPGSGKTTFAAQALSRGARHFGEKGLLVAFEETPEQIVADTASFEWALTQEEEGIELMDARLGDELVHGGDFELAGLLEIVAARAKARGATRVVFDGLDVLLTYLSDARQVRRETFRFRDWVQRTGLTTIITAKEDPRYPGAIADYDFLQFMADCVVNLQQRVEHTTASRLLQVAKYRGRAHSANEFPFTITAAGIDLGAPAQLELRHQSSSERVSTGVGALDGMLEGGYFRGTSTLISGAPGTAKSTLALAFAAAAASRRERTLVVSFDEAPGQIVRNMSRVGIELAPHVEDGTLVMVSLKSRARGPEAHVGAIRALLDQHSATHLILDPASALLTSGGDADAEAAVVRLLDLTKSQGITSVFTSLLANQAPLSEDTPIGVSTTADTWIHLSYSILAGERNRGLTVVKSRGTSHSNQVRELLLSSSGIRLADVYSVGGEVLMGTMRWLKEIEQSRASEVATQEETLREREAELRVAEAKAKAQAALAEEAMCEAALSRTRAEHQRRVEQASLERAELRLRRGAAEGSSIPLGEGPTNP